MSAEVAAAPVQSSLPTLTAEGRPIQVRPCKYYPNCAKMEDPEHNAMYSHNAVVKRAPRPASSRGGLGGSGGPAVPGGNLQLCGFGDQCKRCGDEDHLDKYIHSCKFGNRCKKIDDPVHLKRFIHVLPGSFPPPALPATRSSRHGGFHPYSNPYMGAYPPYPPYPYPPPMASSGYGASPYPGAAAAGASYSPPHSTHAARAAAGASYHPYGGASAGAGGMGGGYGAARGASAVDALGAGAAAAGVGAGYGNYGSYSAYNEGMHAMLQGADLSQYGM